MDTLDLVQAAPSDLRLVANIRDAQPNDDLIASVRQHGILEPITAYRDTDGTLVVRRGHRRTLAAVAADLDTVPVLVIPTPGDTDADHIERIATQWDENAHRADLTRREQADAMSQLAAFGVSPTEIARTLRVPRQTVDAALTVAGSDLLDQYDLTLDQAAVVDEFTDDPKAVAALVDAARGDQFEHTVARLRQQRTLDAARAEAAATWTERGVTVLTDWPDYTADSGWLDTLVNDDGTPATIDPDNPGEHAHVYLTADFATIHTATGEPIDPYEVWPDDADDAPEGAVRASDCHEGIAVQERWWCPDVPASPWTSRWARHSTRTEDQAEPTEEEREARRAERRDVIAANRAWLAATEVRRAWLTEFCKRKTAPKSAKGIAQFVTSTILTRPHLLSHHHTLNGRGDYLPRREVQSMTGPQATMHTLAAVLVAHELDTHKGSWRGSTATSAVAQYLRQIERLGYTLAPVERRACGEEVATEDL